MGETGLDTWTSGLFFGAMVDEELEADLDKEHEADEELEVDLDEAKPMKMNSALAPPTWCARCRVLDHGHRE